MAEGARTLTVRWVGDVTGLTKATRSIRTSFDNVVAKAKATGGPIGGIATNVESLVGTFRNMGASGQVAFGAAAAGIGALAAGLANATQKALEDAAAARVLEQTLKNVTGATDVQVGSTENWIRDLQNATGVMDDELRPALGSLVRATGDVGSAQSLLTLAMDVSAGSGRGLESITTALAKAQGGSYGALKKLIPTLDVTRAKEEGMVYVTELLGDAFGGQMAASASTAEGKMRILNARWEDAQEQLGARLIPAVTAGAEALITLTDAAGSVDRIMGKAGTGIADVALATAKTVPGLNELVTGYQTVTNLWGDGAKKADAAADAQTNLTEKTAAYARVVADENATEKERSDARAALVDAQRTVATVQGTVNAATEEGTAAAEENTAATSNAAAATLRKRDADKAANDAQLQYTEAIVAGRNAQLGQEGATLNLANSLDGYTEKALAAAAAGGQNAAANRDLEQATIDVKQDILNVASAAQEAAQKNAELSGKTLSAKESADAQKVALQQLSDKFAPGSPLRIYLDGLIADLDRAAKPRTAQFTIDVIQAKTGGQALGALLKQHGGPVKAGHPYVVGEAGPELFVPRNTGKIVPNRNGGSAAAVAGTTYNQTFNVNVTTSGLGADAPEIQRAVVTALRRWTVRNGPLDVPVRQVS